ncbi:MAG: dUTP diphosphatase, partial [Clostridia bacterium]|nr:dUTP diphosphatase [Clostridia bacterium]
MKIKLLSDLYKNGTLKPPFYATEEAAGIDLPACIDEDIILEPMQRALIPTGIAAEIPKGYAGMIYARSGLAVKHGITLINAV